MAKTVFVAGGLIKSADVNANFDGAYDGTLDTTANSLVTFRDEMYPDCVVSGAVINTSANLTQTTSSGVFMIDGYRVTIGATAKTYTASKDTYVDVLRSGSTASYVYTEVTLNAASPALAANSIRIARVVTSGTAITLAAQAGGDSLGNEIYPLPFTNTAWRSWINSSNVHIGTGVQGIGNITVGNGTIAAYYYKNGRTINATIGFTLGNSSSIGSNVNFQLPFLANSRYTNGVSRTHSIGTLHLEDLSTTGYLGFIRADGQTTGTLMPANAASTNLNTASITSTSPFSWGTGDFFFGTFSYESAL